VSRSLWRKIGGDVNRPQAGGYNGYSFAEVALVRRKRRRRHSLDAAGVEIFGASFVYEIDDDAINTTRVVQSIYTMAGLPNYDMPTVRQIFCDLLATLRWRNRIEVAGKNQHRRV
jgi:hypothetical protein